jgi:hypothetical protein
MIEPYSATWKFVENYITAETLRVGQQLEQRGCSLADTEFNRGYIAALRGLKTQATPHKDGFVTADEA